MSDNKKLATEQLERESDMLEFLLKAVLGDEVFSDEEFPEAAALSEIGAILEAPDTLTGTLLTRILAKQREQTVHRLAAAKARGSRRRGQQRLLECSETRKRIEEATKDLHSLSDAMEDRDSVLRAETAEIIAQTTQASTGIGKAQDPQNQQGQATTHSEIVSLAAALDKIKREADELQDAIKSFEDLPPDVSLAVLTVEEAKKELARLDEELRQKVEAVFDTT